MNVYSTPSCALWARHTAHFFSSDIKHDMQWKLTTAKERGDCTRKELEPVTATF